MKTYIFIVHQVCDLEDLGIRTRVFTDKQKAIAALKEWRDDEIKDVEKRGYKIELDKPTHFEAYEPGRWCEGHSLGVIEETETE